MLRCRTDHALPGTSRAGVAAWRRLAPTATLGTVTEKRQRAEEQAEAQRAAELAARVRDLSQLSDDEVMGRAASYGQAPLYAVVMQRRLKDATACLAAETIKARESSDRAARRLAWLTFVLVLLTAALVALTVVLAVRK
jgi:hypothetical protein